MCERLSNLLNCPWYDSLSEEQQHIAQWGLCCGCRGCAFGEEVHKKVEGKEEAVPNE